MSLTRAFQHSAQEEEHKPRHPNAAQRLFHPNALETPPTAPPTLTRRRSRSQRPRRHRPANTIILSRRWKRNCLRRSQRKATHRRHTTLLSVCFGIISPFLLLIIVFGGLLGIGLLYYQSQENALALLTSSLPGDSLKIFDSQGTLILELTDEGSQTTIPLSQISKVLQDATIAIEDKDFWTNQGIDFQAIVRATIDDLRSAQVVSGASTITQQLIKNALVGPEVTLDRKLREMILALGLTHVLSKEQILTLYLNTIFYGEQAYGINAAAHRYFSLNDLPGRPAASQLNLAQASLLAGLPRAPSLLDPLINLPGALERQKTVLDQMVAQHYITPAQAAQAQKEASAPGFIKPSGPPANLAPQFSSYILQQVQNLIDLHILSASDLSRSGLRIYTTLNLSLQNQILQIARARIKAMSASHHMTNAAAVLIDYHTGAILALIGSIDYNNPTIGGQFNVATQGWRQPGSSFKPFVYATAFAKGWSPGTVISDTPITIPIKGQPDYSPQNYDHKFHGNVTLRYALQNSFNVPAVKALMFTGIKDSLATAQKMGITDYKGSPGPSMVLGGLDIHLIDETAAYGVFANNGVRVPPFSIQTITDQNNLILYQHASQPQQVISPQIAGLITNVLADDHARHYEFGMCSPLVLYDGPPYSPSCQRGNTGPIRPAAVKTGTTQDFRDNWTVGYTTDFVLGVWTGNNNGSPMQGVSGVDGAAPIWHDAMLAAERGRPIQNFILPHGLILATVRYPGGVTSTDWYLPGTVPPNGIIRAIS